MIEIPESKSLSLQANKALKGKKAVKVFPPSYIHKLAWFEGDPKDYPKFLEDKRIKSVNGHGMFVDIHFEGDVSLFLPKLPEIVNA